MSGGKERIAPEVIAAVEAKLMARILATRDKDITAEFGISRASIFRIIRAARQRMKQESQSRE